MRILVAPPTEDEYHSWEEMESPALSILKLCESYEDGVQVEATDGNVGAGADLPVVILQVIKIGGLVAFGIPAVHKKIRESIGEWRLLLKNIKKFVGWLDSKKSVYACSVEVSVLYALEHLSAHERVDELTFISATEIVGVSGAERPGFENAELTYFEIHFENPGVHRHIVILDEAMKVVLCHKLALHPIVRMEDRQSGG